MGSISVYGHDPDMLTASDSLYLHHPKAPTKAKQPQMSNLKSCPFLKLPLELRIHIYTYVLPNTIGHLDRGVVWIRATAAIWATSRQVYKECIRLMYGNPTFLLDIKYDKIDFLYQWILPQVSLVPKRIFNFPDPIAACYRPLMRKFHVRVHQVDGYTGMIKYNYGNPEILARGLRCQAKILSAFLNETHEIDELQISYHGGDEESHKVLPLLMEPFWQLKKTKTVIVQDPGRVNETLRMNLQERLTDAYTKNSLMRLPLELREQVYRHALPRILIRGTDDEKAITWSAGDISILGTCRQVNFEATRVLYATNELELG